MIFSNMQHLNFFMRFGSSERIYFDLRFLENHVDVDEFNVEYTMESLIISEYINNNIKKLHEYKMFMERLKENKKTKNKIEKLNSEHKKTYIERDVEKKEVPSYLLKFIKRRV